MSRRLLFLLPLATLALMAGFFAWSLMAGRDPASIGSVMVGRPAPRLDLRALRDGDKPLTDAMLRTGKPTIVNFFASWCTPCLAEHPLFTRLAQRDGAVIIGIAWKNKPEEARAWLAKLGDPFLYAGQDFDGRTGSRLGPERRARDLPDRRQRHRALPLPRPDHREGCARYHPAVPQGRQAVRRAVALLLMALLALPALAVEPSEMLKDPALEARAREIGQALRCVVCQNQSIDDSAAEVARDMRRAVRERLSAGDSDTQVFDFMVARYGDYVLLKPPFKLGTLLLWLGAPLVLLIAAAAIMLTALRRRATAPLPPLSDEERERLRSLLGR